MVFRQGIFVLHYRNDRNEHPDRCLTVFCASPPNFHRVGKTEIDKRTRQNARRNANPRLNPVRQNVVAMIS